MKITAILLDHNNQRLEEHQLLCRDSGIRTEDITAARDFLMKRATLKGLRPAAGYTFASATVRVWAQPMGDAITQYYTDRANGHHAAKAP